MGFTVKRVLGRVLRRGSEKGVSRRCLERPLVEYAPLGVRPSEKLTRSGLNGVRSGTFEKQICYKIPTPKRTKNCFAKRPFFISKKGPVKKPL